MKIRHIVSLTFGSILLLMIYLAVYLGLFKSVDFEIKESEAHLLLAKSHFGPYHKIVPSIEEVEKWVRENTDQKCQKSFGRFLDDPKTTEQERLRSQVGCILESPLTQSLPSGMKIIDLPSAQSIVVKFNGSPAIGPYKVYMKVDSLLKEKGLLLAGPTLEIYEVLSEKEMHTTYEFPIKSQY